MKTQRTPPTVRSNGNGPEMGKKIVRGLNRSRGSRGISGLTNFSLKRKCALLGDSNLKLVVRESGD